MTFSQIQKANRDATTHGWNDGSWSLKRWKDRWTTGRFALIPSLAAVTYLGTNQPVSSIDFFVWPHFGEPIAGLAVRNPFRGKVTDKLSFKDGPVTKLAVEAVFGKITRIATNGNEASSLELQGIPFLRERADGDVELCYSSQGVSFTIKTNAVVAFTVFKAATSKPTKTGLVRPKDGFTAGDWDESDLAHMNLLCAEGLPGTDDAVASNAVVELDAWAKRVARETEKYLSKFKANPADFNHSEGYFRILTLVTVLQQDLGVHYNQERIRSPDFADSRDLFLHGLLTGKREGTCVSMPVLYVAVGRKLGYPLKLVTAKGHLFGRWESPKERFNIEATGDGLSCFPDEYYHTWPAPLTTEEIASGQYLKSLTPEEELAVFLSARGNCLEANGSYSEARQAYAEAHLLAPNIRLYQSLIDRATAKEDSNSARHGAEVSARISRTTPSP
jgi:hypothetical protein